MGKPRINFWNISYVKVGAIGAQKLKVSAMVSIFFNFSSFLDVTYYVAEMEIK